jgi:hypothetical protein
MRLLEKTTKHIVLAMLASGLLAPAAAAAQQSRAPQTDETVAASKGARLAVDNFAGEVVIRAWDRDQVRVQARHSVRTEVRVRATESAVSVSSSSGGAPEPIDYEISVPAWMPVKAAGTYIFITIEGTRAEVTAETVRGDVTVKGGSGGLSAKSVEGQIVLEGVRGRINAQSTNEGITITDASGGGIVAETINGSINLTKVSAPTVDVSTVNGNIRFDGTPASNGQYRFNTHNGNINVAVPESAHATFHVRTYHGRFTSALPVKGDGDAQRGRRVSFVLGNGSAEFVLESFGGTVSLHKPGELPAPRSRTRSRD